MNSIDSTPSKPNVGGSWPSRRTAPAVWRQSRRAPLYEISDQGEVRCESGPRKSHPDRTGYPSLTLSLGDGAKKTFRVHQLVADAFLGPCPVGMEVNHIDGDKANSAASNLEYVSHAENQKHAFATGLQVPVKGERHGRSKLTEEKVRELRANPKKHTLREWARRFGVSMSAVCQAVNGQSWAHVSVSR